MRQVGLSQQDAVRRLRLDGPNRLPSDKPRGFFQQVVAVLSEPMLLLLVAAALINFTTLLSGNLLLMMTNRSSSVSLLKILRYSKNLAALVIFLIGLLILVLVYLVPGLQEAFRFDPVSPSLGLLSSFAGLAPVVFNESLKFVQGRRRKS